MLRSMANDHILGLDLLNQKKVQVIYKCCDKGFPKTLSRIFIFVTDGFTVISDS